MGLLYVITFAYCLVLVNPTWEGIELYLIRGTQNYNKKGEYILHTPTIAFEAAPPLHLNATNLQWGSGSEEEGAGVVQRMLSYSSKFRGLKFSLE